MDDEKRSVQKALNRSLSGLLPNPHLVRRVIAEAEGERTMKKKLSGGLILALVLTLLLIGSAYAAFSSQVAEFFKTKWNPEMGEWLEKGKAAQIGETVRLGGVSITLDEIVYRSRGLYAVGSVRALDEKDVLVPSGMTYGAEGFRDGEAARSLIDQARKSGGRLLTARCVPHQIAVDGGEALPAGGFTYSDKKNQDGSLSFGFQVVNGLAITEAKKYTLKLSLETEELTENGIERNGTWEKTSLTVEFTPQPIAEGAPADPAASVDFDVSDYALLTPEDYRATGTLPVFRAVTPDYAGIVSPDWFTDQRVAEEGLPGLECFYLMEDNSVLTVSSESVYFSEYEGTYEETQALTDPDPVEAVYAEDALSREIAELAEAAFYGEAVWDDIYGEIKTPSRDALYRITRKQAEEKAESILRRLGISDYQCGFCLDMSVERIREMGGAMKRAIEEGRYLTDDDRKLDFERATEADEGFFLYYAPLGLHQVSRERFKMLIYVTARGIPYASIRCEYLKGEIVERPGSLVTPESVLPALALENSQSRRPVLIDKITGFALIYTPTHDQNGGMVMTPTWHVTFRQRSTAQGLEREGWAEFNAVGGEMLDASFL